MTWLSAPADGALGPLAADLLDSDVWFPLVVVLLFLAFAIGHLTGRVEARVRRTEAARPQGIAECPRREMTDSEFAEWSERLHGALRAVQADDRAPTVVASDKRVVCGRPARTSLGAVRCLARPGHSGRC